jgi:hypothetical protein
LHIRLFPFVKRAFSLSDIRHCEARTYSLAIGEYGGWGIRRSWRNGVAYNMMGDRGVQLELKDGKKVLIGSQRAEELVAAIHRAMRYS